MRLGEEALTETREGGNRWAGSPETGWVTTRGQTETFALTHCESLRVFSRTLAAGVLRQKVVKFWDRGAGELERTKARTRLETIPP